MAENFKVACVQMNGRAQVEENLRSAADFIRAAAAQGAQLIATPENTDRIAADHLKAGFKPYTQEEHPALPFFAALSAELSVHLLIGSLGIKLESGKSANRSFLFGPGGDILAAYDKIHLFDVDLPTGESHRESSRIAPGDKAVVVDAARAKLGLSICYDLRFAALYRALARRGAEILCVPSAFTVPTGKAHWEVLLRARAIETGSFVIAPAQTGTHDGGRRTYGHSMIVGPWGQLLAAADGEPGIILAELNLQDVVRARSAIPALQHDRAFKPGTGTH